MAAQLKRKTSRKQFDRDLMEKYSGNVVHSKVISDSPEHLEDGKSPWMYLYYTTEGLTDEHKEINMTERHCGTWMRGEGWEFLTDAEPANL